MSDQPDKMIAPKEVEANAEKEPLLYLDSIGIKARKVPRTSAKTPDYEFDGNGIEVTALHDFSPALPDLDSIRRYLLQNPGNDYYVYTYSDASGLHCEVLMKQKCQDNLSILRTRQHVSTYRKKIINKIDEKYDQIGDYDALVIVMDFRTAPFDAASIHQEVLNILKDIGDQYSSLSGILVGVNEDPYASVLNKATYFYVKNPHAKKALSEFDKVSTVPDIKMRIMPHHAELMMKNLIAGQKNPITISAPQFISLEELQKRGLPT